MGSPPSGEAVAFVGDAGCEIAVGFLGCGNQIYDAVEIVVEIFVVFHGKRI